MPAFWSEHLKYASFSAEAMDLLSQMLLLDPDERITVQEIHEHPWCLYGYNYIDIDITNRYII